MGKFASLDGKLTPWPSDFVKNKGEGRIFLLHGSPGVGKTCTAECAAELARRPLLALTNGDLGPGQHIGGVENALNYFLTLGERFGALVLLDEADVYLEKRRTRDLHRNGLVSVFLRALEYYKGVLFLTTNRVEAFDDAFTSRIHVALHYKRLGDEDRRRIWMHNFERLGVFTFFFTPFPSSPFPLPPFSLPPLFQQPTSKLTPFTQNATLPPKSSSRPRPAPTPSTRPTCPRSSGTGARFATRCRRPSRWPRRRPSRTGWRRWRSRNGTCAPSPG